MLSEMTGSVHDTDDDVKGGLAHIEKDDGQTIRGGSVSSIVTVYEQDATLLDVSNAWKVTRVLPSGNTVSSETLGGENK